MKNIEEISLKTFRKRVVQTNIKIKLESKRISTKLCVSSLLTCLLNPILTKHHCARIRSSERSCALIRAAERGLARSERCSLQHDNCQLTTVIEGHTHTHRAAVTFAGKDSGDGMLHLPLYFHLERYLYGCMCL